VKQTSEQSQHLLVTDSSFHALPDLAIVTLQKICLYHQNYCNWCLAL